MFIAVKVTLFTMGFNQIILYCFVLKKIHRFLYVNDDFMILVKSILETAGTSLLFSATLLRIENNCIS